MCSDRVKSGTSDGVRNFLFVTWSRQVIQNGGNGNGASNSIAVSVDKIFYSFNILRCQ
jgi:hypothetical protein